MHLPVGQLTKEPVEIPRIDRQLNQEVHPGEAAAISPNQPTVEARDLPDTITEEAASDHQDPTNPVAVPVVPGLPPEEAHPEAVHRVQDQVPEVPVEAVPGRQQGSR
jgi:hypothetical protein